MISRSDSESVPCRKDSSRFFANRGCEYYPCHPCDTEINCLFCYCPLYYLDCPGNYVMKEKDGRRIKSCVNCLFPHIPGNYDRVIGLLKEQNGCRCGPEETI